MVDTCYSDEAAPSPSIDVILDPWSNVAGAIISQKISRIRVTANHNDYCRTTGSESRHEAPRAPRLVRKGYPFADAATGKAKQGQSKQSGRLFRFGQKHVTTMISTVHSNSIC